MKPVSGRRRRHAQIHLPALDPCCALAVVDFLQRAIHAIRRVHGDRIDELAAMRAAGPRRRRSDYIDDGNPDAPNDTYF
jgi:hypothetical protein